MVEVGDGDKFDGDDDDDERASSKRVIARGDKLPPPWPWNPWARKPLKSNVVVANADRILMMDMMARSGRPVVRSLVPVTPGTEYR